MSKLAVPPRKPLGELVAFLDHKRRPVRETERNPGPYPYFGANGQQGSIDGYLFDDQLVLLAEDGGHFEQPNRGIAYRVSGKVWVNNHAHVLRPGPEIDWAFLARMLENMDVRPFVSGTTRGKLTKGQAEKIPIPVPPLPEQRRIAAILDQADALRAKRRQTLTQLDEMARAIFVEMFGDHATNPRKLDVVRLDQVTDCLDYQRRPVKASDRAEGQIPYYGANGQQGWIDRPLFDEALVLVAEDGGHFEEPERGVAYRIDGPAWVNNHAHILRARKELLDTEYLHRALRHYNFAPYISGTTRAKLTQGQLNSAKVMLPPLPDQRRFSERIEAVEGLRQLGTTSALDLDNLFTSLQHRAFRGEL